jgi:hypothetical protein
VHLNFTYQRFGIHVALNILQPLTGMRGDAGAIWTLSQQSNVANDSMAAPETIGLVMQLVVLVAAILLTEYYIRTEGNQRTQIEPGNYNNGKPQSLQPISCKNLNQRHTTAASKIRAEARELNQLSLSNNSK